MERSFQTFWHITPPEILLADTKPVDLVLALPWQLPIYNHLGSWFPRESSENIWQPEAYIICQQRPARNAYCYPWKPKAISLGSPTSGEGSFDGNSVFGYCWSLSGHASNISTSLKPSFFPKYANLGDFDYSEGWCYSRATNNSTFSVSKMAGITAWTPIRRSGHFCNSRATSVFKLP